MRCLYKENREIFLYVTDEKMKLLKKKKKAMAQNTKKEIFLKRQEKGPCLSGFTSCVTLSCLKRSKLHFKQK